MSSKGKKVLIGLLGAMNGISGITASAAIIAYDSIFPRYERPNYDLYPGNYCYSRIDSNLPREEVTYKVKQHKLRGHYYPSQINKGIVIIAHGMHAGGDDYLPIVEYVYHQGFSVFSYNVTGTYESEGSGTIGMCQSIIDLEGTIKYIESDNRFKNTPIFLIGHSWGGYAVSSVLSLCQNINACAVIAGMNNGCTMMVDKAEEYVGKIGTLPGPIFNTYQRILFKDYVDLNGVIGINTKDIPVLIAHGVDDKVITFDKQALIAQKENITNPNVEYYIGKGLNGDHDNIWHSIESCAYQLEVKSDLKLLEMKKNEKLTEEEKIEYYKTINHKLYSEVNKELMDKIISMFNKTL